jgi:hypothetical protein
VTAAAAGSASSLALSRTPARLRALFSSRTELELLRADICGVARSPAPGDATSIDCPRALPGAGVDGGAGVGATGGAGVGGGGRDAEDGGTGDVDESPAVAGVSPRSAATVAGVRLTCIPGRASTTDRDERSAGALAAVAVYKWQLKSSYKL